MKRVDLIRHIEANGCAFLREGGRHTVYFNPTSRKVSTIPRHREINDFMAKKICRELEIAEPGQQKKSDQGEQGDAVGSG
jgi:predicted RNA binding protein YcfA (HicA-like mRNA interferase family)